jgi:cyclic pyranopterin monophosphate synthase
VAAAKLQNGFLGVRSPRECSQQPSLHRVAGDVVAIGLQDDTQVTHPGNAVLRCNTLSRLCSRDQNQSGSVSTNQQMGDPESQPSGGLMPAHGLTHVDGMGQANMVDVGHKQATERRAVAEAVIRLDAATCELLFAGKLPKGEALAVARIAGIQAAKETSRLIPLCHQLSLSHVAIAFEPHGDGGVRIQAEAATVSGTGVEMEAMTAAAVAALTVYDMVKARCRAAVIEQVRLLHKSGGKSGEYNRAEASPASSPREEGR